MEPESWFWPPKAYCFNGPSEKTIVLVGIYKQQCQGTIFLIAIDVQGIPIRPVKALDI